VGVALGTPDHHRWLVGSAGSKGAGEENQLIDDGNWHSYHFDFSPGDHTWFTPDGARAVDPGAITSLRIMAEANWGTASDAYFDNFSFRQCDAACSSAADEPLPAVPGPDPVVARTANAVAIKPGVLVEQPGSTSFVALSDPQQIQMGSTIDARQGKVRISISDGKGGVDTADFSEGVFRLTQSAKGTKFATLTLVGGNFKGCPRAPKPQLAKGPSPNRSVRHLWGSGNGNFRTVGRFSAASLRGTTWLTDDKCGATLTRVTKGSVSVRDFVRRKTIVIKSPGRYLAKPRA
jgi:hypothetical protein